ncbi:MAG: calcium/proton exchanger [Chloroflexi bacterium]|nr:calcium/proton exchanger [Chloroflexota bacterium]
MSLRRYLRSNPLNLLVIGLPLAAGARLAGMSDVVVFILSGVAIVPLAGLIGHATDELGSYVGPGIGGLLNATFGNATELIIVLLALREGLVEVVKASISGSILGNLLLVLGLAFLVGGWRRERQIFNRLQAGASVAVLFLAVVAMVMPAVYAISVFGTTRTESETELAMSVLVAVVMLVTYAGSLIFSLRTHRELLSSVGHAETEPPQLSREDAMLLLAGATVLTAVAAELLVGSIEPTAQALGLSEFFIGVVLVAIIGNAAEHFAAVWLAQQDKMDLALTIAISSGSQVALLVAPFAVLASLVLGHPMALLFNPFELAALILAVLAVSMALQDGESNWLEGLQLLSIYAVLAIVFFYVPG